MNPGYNEPPLSSSNWTNSENQEQLKPPLKKVRSFDTGISSFFFYLYLLAGVTHDYF
jgi:hypothetical protein